MKERYLVSKSFEYDSLDGVTHKIEVGELISYEIYTDCNMNITLYCRSGTIDIYGHEKNIEDYLRPITYDDLKHPHEYIFEQSKGDRTYREGQEDNTVIADSEKVIEDGKLEEYSRKRVDVGTILDYLNLIDCKPLSKDTVQFLQSEKERLDKEYDKLTLLTATDEEIVKKALIRMKKECLKEYDMDVAHKVEDVLNKWMNVLVASEEEQK